MTETVTLYGRTVDLEPLDPGETIEHVVVVVKTTNREGIPSHQVMAANDQDGEPARMSGDLRYLIDLGMDPEQIGARAGRTATAITRELAQGDTPA